jgi:hypothetical protein
MTREYIVGELSALLAELEPAPTTPLNDAVRNLRHEVEFSPLPTLPRLTQEALDLTDSICRAALEQGDANRFCRYVGTAIPLRDFAVGASLLP